MEDDFFFSCASSLTSTEPLHVNRSCLFMPTLVHCGNNVSLTAIKSDLADQISLINCVHTWTFAWWGAIQLQSNHESTRRCQAKDFDFSRHPRAAFDCWHFENKIIRCYCFSQRLRNSESQRYFFSFYLIFRHCQCTSPCPILVMCAGDQVLVIPTQRCCCDLAFAAESIIIH